MLRRCAKIGAAATLAAGAYIGVSQSAFEIDLGNIAVVRMGRSAWTATSIVYIYKTELKSLRKKNLDRDGDDYAIELGKIHQKAANKVLQLCTANKGVYIKVGQHIGSLEYLLPMPYVNTMKVLMSHAPTTSLSMVYKVMKAELKRNPEEVFCHFEAMPIGSASLAQVHKATLKENGRTVAVKVQHDFLYTSVALDIKIMEFAVKMSAAFFPEFRLQWLIEETKKNVWKELNFIEEGKNSERVAEIFKSFKWLKIPKIYWDYSTRRLLVMDFIEGEQIDNLEYINSRKIDRFDLAKKLGQLYSNMIFIDGFVHADPHPGNVIVYKDEKSKDVTVYLLDHGLYANLTEKFRYDYSQLWLSIIARDRAAMKMRANNLGIRNELYGLFACIVTGRSWTSLEKGIDRVRPSEEEKLLFQLNAPSFVHKITDCLQDVDRQALLVLKTNDCIRSIETKLGVNERMPGFQTMTTCCVKSQYNLEYKNAIYTKQKLIVTIMRYWTLIRLYLYFTYMDIRSLVG